MNEEDEVQKAINDLKTSMRKTMVQNSVMQTLNASERSYGKLSERESIMIARATHAMAETCFEIAPFLFQIEKADTMEEIITAANTLKEYTKKVVEEVEEKMAAKKGGANGRSTEH